MAHAVQTRTCLVQIDAGDGISIVGSLALPDRARGAIVFAHGAGSNRHSPRNHIIAATLNAGGFATLLLDLLTPAEERADRATAALRFDIGLLAGRLIAARRWASSEAMLEALPVGYFGSNTGAAAALVAAAESPAGVRAVVSRGGRTDLAGTCIGGVLAPTLLVVGGADLHVLDLNRQSLRSLNRQSELDVVQHASHLFPERGTLEEVARLSCGWFIRHLRTSDL
jgi:putative phosphoribosyl transferase